MIIKENKTGIELLFIFDCVTYYQFNNNEELAINMLRDINNTKSLKYDYYDGEKNLLDKNKTRFIEFDSIINPDIDFKMTSKSKILEYFEQIIKNNYSCFTSVEKIRESLKELKTDQGIYALKKILSSGLNKSITIDNIVVDHKFIAKLLYVEYEELSDIEKRLILLNITVAENCDKEIIIYFNNQLDESILNWITTIAYKNGLKIIVNLEKQIDNYLLKPNIYLLKNNEYVTFEIEEYELYVYALKKTTLHTREYQKNEIKEIIDEYLMCNKSIYFEKLNYELNYHDTINPIN